MGVDVLLVGPMPTPAIAFLTRSLRADAGVVISASHNPYQDNGIKFFSSDGFKLPDDVEARIEQLIVSNEISHLRPTADLIGKAYRIDDADGRYIEVNDRWLEMGKLKREQVIGKTSTELGIWADPNDRIRLVEAIQLVMRTA